MGSARCGGARSPSRRRDGGGVEAARRGCDGGVDFVRVVGNVWQRDRALAAALVIVSSAECWRE